MAEGSPGGGGRGGSPLAAAPPLPDSDDWGEARSEGEEVKAALEEPGPPAYHGDRLFYRIVVWSLALVAVGALLGGMILAGFGRDVPDTVLALGSAAVGALAGVVSGNRNQV